MIYMYVCAQKFDAAKYHWDETKVKVFLVVSIITNVSVYGRRPTHVVYTNLGPQPFVSKLLDKIMNLSSDCFPPHQVRRHCVSQVDKTTGHTLADYLYKDVEYMAKVCPVRHTEWLTGDRHVVGVV